MAGVYSGNFDDAKLIHPLDDEDGDEVGPGAWTIQGSTTFQTAGARFGKALLSDASGEGLKSDVGISGINESDGAKILIHCFWEADDISFNRSMMTLTESGFGQEKAAMFFEVFGPGRIVLRWIRDTDLVAGEPLVGVFSNTGKIAIDTPFELVAFLDSGSISAGKIFINGTDETASVSTVATSVTPADTYNFAFLGNFVNGLNPARILDHITVIQSSGLSNAKAANLLAQYAGVRGFGYRPTFENLVAA